MAIYLVIYMRLLLDFNGMHNRQIPEAVVQSVDPLVAIIGCIALHALIAHGR